MRSLGLNSTRFDTIDNGQRRRSWCDRDGLRRRRGARQPRAQPPCGGGHPAWPRGPARRCRGGGRSAALRRDGLDERRACRGLEWAEPLTSRSAPLPVPNSAQEKTAPCPIMIQTYGSAGGRSRGGRCWHPPPPRHPLRSRRLLASQRPHRPDLEAERRRWSRARRAGSVPPSRSALSESAGGSFVGGSDAL
jgi:hypothetical protein